MTATIVIGVVAVTATLLGLAWKVKTDLGLKARVKVSANVALFNVPSGRFKKIVLSAVNHGPGEITLTGVSLDPPKEQKKNPNTRRLFLTGPEIDFPYASPLPAKLAVGQEAKIVLPYEKDCFLQVPHGLGVLDSFKRVHWAPKEDMRRAEAEYAKEFPS